MTVDARLTIVSAVQAANLPVTDSELEALIQMYPALKAGIESLYKVAEAHYEEPCLILTSNPASVW